MCNLKSIIRIPLLVFLFISCQSDYTKNETILRAEAVLYTAPDSAYQLLTSIQAPEKLPDADYAAWCLHYTHACYKLQKKIKSDSLILISVNYYKNTNLLKYSGTAYYLLGIVKKMQQKNKEAMTAYKQAENILTETNENKIKGLVEFNMGYNCMQDELYDYSLSYFRKSLYYLHLSKEIKYQAYAYREISNMYFQLDYPSDSVMYYSNIALKLSKETGDSVNYYYILARQGVLLYDIDSYRAKEYLLKGYRFSAHLRPHYAAFLSFIYSKLNIPDSARYYQNISLADTTNQFNKMKFLSSAYIAKDEKKYAQAFYFLEKAYLSRDSLFQQSIHSQLYRIDKQYDLTKEIEEKAALIISNRNKVIWITLLIIFALLILIILMLFNRQQKKKQAIHQLEKKQLEFEIKAKKSENEQKRKLLLSKLQSRIENTLNLNRIKLGLSQSEKHEAFVAEITKQSTLSEKEWKYYIDEVNHVFNQKIAHLSQSNSKLTHSDLTVIILICLQLDIADTCSLLNMNKNAIYHRRSIIKERIGIDMDIDLEKWIRENISGDGD